MHLIEVAKLMGDANPGSLWRHTLRIERRLETNILAKSFGVNPISAANRRSYCRRLKELQCKVRNSDRTIATISVVGRFHDGVLFSALRAKGNK